MGNQSLLKIVEDSEKYYKPSAITGCVQGRKNTTNIDNL